MNEALVVDLARQTLWIAIEIVAPALLVGTAIGIVVSLFQAVTSLQEQTLTLVPKMLGVAVTLMLMLPWILNKLYEFAIGLFENLAAIAGLA
ncbi:MAG: flagellar biosynthetic protein FliQ [Planctomycetes bacterium]|nr:flagellar biosynthetic protein FliQ [Planctomycetota bacterium]MCB9917149.1 flagellar biosynthetic protein FliQ [Planctomycetota bacterium]